MCRTIRQKSRDKEGRVRLLFPHEIDVPCGTLLSLSAAPVCRDLCSFFSYPTKKFVFSQVLKHWCWPIFTHFRTTFSDASFEDLRVVPMTISGLWDTASRRLVCMHQSFRGSSCLVLSIMCRQLVPQKRWYLYMYQPTRRYVLENWNIRRYWFLVWSQRLISIHTEIG
jgi:hypothetical protein